MEHNLGGRLGIVADSNAKLADILHPFAVLDIKILCLPLKRSLGRVLPEPGPLRSG